MKVKFLLKIKINDVQILGMGGVGKTTLVRIISDMLSPQFDVNFFLEDIKENKQNALSAKYRSLWTAKEKEDFILRKS